MGAERNGGWYERASGVLADAGYRRGGARLAVIGLLDAEPCALSAIEIEEALRHKEGAGRTASRASIYRVLDELTELGLVARLEGSAKGLFASRPCARGTAITTT
jgi:Fur family ferric uptake transcriptional regulator